MPELPEVEVARRALEEHCVGKRIIECSVAEDPKVIDGVSPSDLESALVGKTILAALRKGKNLWLRLDSPPFPTFQFGMAGAVYIKGVALTKYKRSAVSDRDEWPSKYSKVLVKLEDRLEFSFTDKRRFARVRLIEDPESTPPISELGPDALLDLMPVDEFFASLSRKNIAIKTLLLDQSYISGIGNWIADEVLYQARIHPLQIASSLLRESCESLHKHIREVIDKALEVGADSSQFPKDWIFHFREKKPGKAFVNGIAERTHLARIQRFIIEDIDGRFSLTGKKIEFITVGGRTTAYVPELQKLTGKQVEAAPQKKAKGSRSGRTADKEESENEEEDKDGSKQKSKGRRPKKESNKIKDETEASEGSSKKRSKSSQANTRAKAAKK